MQRTQDPAFKAGEGSQRRDDGVLHAHVVVHQPGSHFQGRGDIHMVGDQIDTAFAHRKHRVVRADGDLRGEELGVGQGNGGAACRHLEPGTPGIGGIGGNQAGTGGPGGAGRTFGACRACRAGGTCRACRARLPLGTGGTDGADRAGGALRAHGACGACGALSGPLRSDGADRSGGAGIHRGLHGRAQLGGEQHLLLHHVRHGVLHALVDLHDLLKVRRLLQAGQGTKNVLQLFPLGVEDMAQAELLSGDGGDDPVDAALSGQRGVNLRECWHRHTTPPLSSDG